MKKFFTSRAFRQGAAATAITVVLIAAVVLLNLLVGVLGERFGLSLDVTPQQSLTLSDETREFIKTVDKPVSITIFRTEEAFSSGNAYYRQAAELMDGFGRQSGNITVEYVDIIANPAYASQYPELVLDANSILVESEGRTHKLTTADLFNTQFDSASYSTYITSSRAEQALASAILNVTSEEILRLAVIEGHNETPVDAFADTLRSNGYEVETLNLLTGEIDPGVSALVMAAPMRDITEDESQKLDAFLNNEGRLGKALFYMAGAAQPEETPVLDAFLADWGVAVRAGMVFESDSGKWFSLSPLMTLADYAEEEYSAGVQAKALPMAVAQARPLELLFDARSSVSVTALLEFSQASGVMPSGADPETFFSGEVPIDGPRPALTLSTILTYDQTTPLRSHVLVGASDTMVDASILGSTGLANSEYLVNLLNSLLGREQSFSVQNKTISRTELPLTANMAYGLGILFTIVLPLLVLAAGIFVWVRHRHR